MNVSLKGSSWIVYSGDMLMYDNMRDDESQQDVEPAFNRKKGQTKIIVTWNDGEILNLFWILTAYIVF